MKKLFIIQLIFLGAANVFAQKSDTLKQRTVTVTSTFQPTLKPTPKIKISAATPLPDSTRPVLQYDVPAQNITFSYLSPALKPLAATIDTGIHWQNEGYIKAGYGNFTTPYLQTRFSMGDGVKSAINFGGSYTSSKGPIPFQQFSKLGLDAIGIFSTPDNKNEWSGKVFFDNNTQYEYGFQPETLHFSKDELRQRFTTIGGSATFKNKVVNNAGLNYSPSASINLFQDNHGARENNLVISAPVSKSFGEFFAFNLGLTADITTYKSDAGTIANNLYYLSPAVQYKTSNLNLTAGFTPSWDNEAFYLLPNFTAEAKLKDERFILQGGFIGYYNKTSYQYLASVNPWLQQPLFLYNTRIKEGYAGFKGSAGSHFTYDAKVSYLQFSNQPLFVNDNNTGKSFIIVNESAMKDIRIHGEVGYTVQEKFSLLAGMSVNQYTGLHDNEKAWGLQPVQINGALRWQIFKDFLIKSDVYFWDGAPYRMKDLNNGKLQPAADANAGVEFTVLPKLNAWVQFNNLFNNKYERWRQYPVLGFNVLGGIVYSFGDIKTALAK